jgi:hypothetical protein
MRPWIAALLACAAVACGNDATPSAEQSAPVTTAPLSATATPTPAVVTLTPTPAKPTQTALATDLKDGRHYAYLKALDTTKLTLTLDVVQFLTGEEAEKAAADDGEEAYDYYIRNQNTKLRTLTVAPGAAVVVNTLTASETGSSSKDKAITLAKLATYFAKGEAQERVFYVTLSGSRVVKINEQYLP